MGRQSTHDSACLCSSIQISSGDESLSEDCERPVALNQDSQQCCLLFRYCCESTQRTDDGEQCTVHGQETKFHCHLNCSGGVRRSGVKKFCYALTGHGAAVYHNCFNGTHHVLGCCLRCERHLDLLPCFLFCNRSSKSGS